MRLVALKLIVGAIVALGLQAAPGLSATWADLERWSRPAADGRGTENGLGLHLAGPSGTMLLAFTNVQPPRRTRATPGDITVRVAIGASVNPNVLRTATLRFDLDASTDLATGIDLGDRLAVDDPAPGAVIRNGIATMRRADFERLVRADTVAVTVLGLDVAFRADQVAALKDWGGG